MQTMTRDEFARAMEDDDFRERFRKTSSPGPVADQLGVTRQRCHELIQNGKLETLRVVNEDGSLAWLNVYEDSVKAYLRASKRIAAKRVSRLERILSTL